jgi:predicted dienelactone hydrolase
MTMEGRGIPTATFVTHAFDSYARGLCHMQAMESLPIVVIPHPIAARPVDDLRQKVRKVHADLRAALINHA